MKKISIKQKTSNRNAVEMHGCIVCARIFNVLTVYTPDNKLLGCTVTSPDGHIVPDEHQPLVACDSHSAEAIETAYRRWKNRNEEELDHELEEN
jgi:hypothetical protein